MPSSTSNSPIHGASRAGGCLATSSGFSDICKTKAMVSSTARSVTNRVEVSANLSTYFFNVVSEFSSFKLIKKKLLRLFHMQVPGGGGGLLTMRRAYFILVLCITITLILGKS